MKPFFSFITIIKKITKTQNKNTSILASDNVPTISKELNLILTPLQITSPVLPSFNDCTGGILTPHQITSPVLTSLNDCTDNKPCLTLT
ncbi:unnamed protein product [Gordionus sp. m RMFG-2023]